MAGRSGEDDRAVCPLCGGDRARPRLTGYDRLVPRPEDYGYVECEGCGLLWMRPLPGPEEVAGFYPPDYGPHMGGGARRRQRWINRLAIRWYYGTDSVGGPALGRALFRLLERRVLRDLRPPRGANRLLDVGCGAGGLMDRYRDLGWTVKGIEVSAGGAAAARERGLEVHHGTVFDAPYAPGSFDQVLLSHVIEHVLDPRGFLARCAEFLAPGGLLVVLTPNGAAAGLRMFGSCWSWLDAPRHLMLFDPDTIRGLGERAGLRPGRVRTSALPRLVEESQHLLEAQGARLPADPQARRDLVQATGPRRRFRLRRLALAPFVHLSALVGAGDLLEAEFVRP